MGLAVRVEPGDPPQSAPDLVDAKGTVLKVTAYAAPGTFVLIEADIAADIARGGDNNRGLKLPARIMNGRDWHRVRGPGLVGPRERTGNQRRSLVGRRELLLGRQVARLNRRPGALVPGVRRRAAARRGCRAGSNCLDEQGVRYDLTTRKIGRAHV